MSEENPNLIKFTCPDCDTWASRTFTFLKAGCQTCGGTGEVLVRREDLIKMSVKR